MTEPPAKCECPGWNPAFDPCPCAHPISDHDAGECWHGFDAVIFSILARWAELKDRMRVDFPVSQCCGGTGFADYAAVPCPNLSCPTRRREGAT